MTSFVDVGGLGGIGEAWWPYLDRIVPFVFEPNPDAARAARPAVEAQGGKVIEQALGSRKENKILNVTASLGCTSTLTPNGRFLEGYSIAPAFAIQKQIEVECVRYDELFLAGVVPLPHIVKIDVQGNELDVLMGFGDLVGHCIGIQLEAHLRPLYYNQPLLGDIVDYLAKYDLAVRKMQPVDHFDSDIVELDVWFTPSSPRSSRLDPGDRAILSLVEEVWRLPPHRNVFDPSQFS